MSITRTGPAARLSLTAALAVITALVLSLVTLTPARAADATIGSPPVGIASTPSGDGYWIAASDGGVFSFGDAQFYGSMGGQPLNKAVIGMASTPTGKGYWLVASDGGVFSFGDAQFYGSMGGKPLNKPVVGVASTPTGKGYWLLASDGGLFSFGDAQFFGSMGGKPLNAPMVGMAVTPSGKGYWMVGADGGIFCFGDAQFYGSMGGKPLNKPVVAMARTKDGFGYWLVGADGGIFSFGNAAFYGSLGGVALASPVISMTARPDGAGYWMLGGDGGLFAFGAAPYRGRVIYNGTPQPPQAGTLRDKIVTNATAEYSNPAHNLETPSASDCNYFTTAWGRATTTWYDSSKKAHTCPNGWHSEAWCADFAGWIWRQAGANTGDLSAGAVSFRGYGKSHGTWHAGTLAGVQIGDVIGWRFDSGGTIDDHVSVVVAVSAGSVDVIEGNYSQKVNKRTVLRTATGISGYVSPVA